MTVAAERAWSGVFLGWKGMAAVLVKCELQT